MNRELKFKIWNLKEQKMFKVVRLDLERHLAWGEEDENLNQRVFNWDHPDNQLLYD